MPELDIPPHTNARSVSTHTDDTRGTGLVTEHSTALPARYQIGDTVWWMHTWKVPETLPCPLCDGTRNVPLEGKDRTVRCPDCRDGTTVGPGEETRCYIEPRTIGQIRVVVTVDQPIEITYMAHESGIGSGSVLPEEKLFPTFDAAVEASNGATRVYYG